MKLLWVFLSLLSWGFAMESMDVYPGRIQNKNYYGGSQCIPKKFMDFYPGKSHKKSYHKWSFLTAAMVLNWATITSSNHQLYLEEVLAPSCAHENHLLDQIFSQENLNNGDKLMIQWLYDGVVSNKSSFFDDNNPQFQGQREFSYVMNKTIDYVMFMGLNQSFPRQFVETFTFSSLNLLQGNPLTIDRATIGDLFRNYTSFVCGNRQDPQNQDYVNNKNYNSPIKEWIAQIFHKHSQELSKTNGTHQCYEKYFKKFEKTVAITPGEKIGIQDGCLGDDGCLAYNVFDGHPLNASLNFLGSPFNIINEAASVYSMITRGLDGNLWAIIHKKTMAIKGVNYEFFLAKAIDANGFICDDRPQWILNPMKNNLDIKQRWVYEIFYNKSLEKISCTMDNESKKFQICSWKDAVVPETFFINGHDYFFKIFNVIAYEINVNHEDFKYLLIALPWEPKKQLKDILIDHKPVNGHWNLSTMDIFFFDKILNQKSRTGDQCDLLDNQWIEEFLNPLDHKAMVVGVNNVTKNNGITTKDTIDGSVSIPLWIQDLSWQWDSNLQEDNYLYGFKPFLSKGVGWKKPLDNLLMAANNYSLFHYHCSMDSQVINPRLDVFISDKQNSSLRRVKLLLNDENLWLQESNESKGANQDLWGRIINTTLWDGTMWLSKATGSFALIPLTEDFLNLAIKSFKTHKAGPQYKFLCGSILKQKQLNPYVLVNGSLSWTGPPSFFYFDNQNLEEALHNSTYDVNYRFHSINFLPTFLQSNGPQDKSLWMDTNHRHNQSAFFYSIFLRNNGTGHNLWRHTLVAENFTMVGCDDQCFTLDFQGFPKKSMAMTIHDFNNSLYNGSFNNYQWNTQKLLISQEDQDYPCGLYRQKTMDPSGFLICFNGSLNDFNGWRWMFNLDKNFMILPPKNNGSHWDIALINGDVIKISQKSFIGFSGIYNKKYPKTMFKYQNYSMELEDFFNNTFNFNGGAINFYYPHEILLDSQLKTSGKGFNNSYDLKILFNNHAQIYQLCYPDSTANYLCFDGDWQGSMMYYNWPSNNNFNYLKQYKPQETTLKKWLNGTAINGTHYAFNRTSTYLQVEYDDFSCEIMIDSRLKKKLILPIAHHCTMKKTSSEFIELLMYPRWDFHQQQWISQTQQYFLCRGFGGICDFSLLNGTKITCDDHQCWSNGHSLNNNFLDRLLDAQLMNTVKKYVNDTLYFIGLHPKKTYFLPSLINFSLAGIIKESLTLEDFVYWKTYQTPLLVTDILWAIGSLMGGWFLKKYWNFSWNKWRKPAFIIHSGLTLVPNFIGFIAIANVYYGADGSKINQEDYIYYDGNNFNTMAIFMGNFWILMALEALTTATIVSSTLFKMYFCFPWYKRWMERRKNRYGYKTTIDKSFINNQWNVWLIKNLILMVLTITNQQILMDYFPQSTIEFIGFKL
jgi:hypothetical protein